MVTRHVLICRFSRRIWHLAILQVAGLHRAVPSTTLDKAVQLCHHYTRYSVFVKVFFAGQGEGQVDGFLSRTRLEFGTLRRGAPVCAATVL